LFWNTIWSFTAYSALRQVRSLLQGTLYRQRELVLPVSNYTTFSFLSGHPIAAHAFFVFLSSILSFLQDRNLKGNSYSSCHYSNFPSFALRYVRYSILPLRFVQFNFFIRFILLIFSILFQRHI
jgi:hypothetical protein